MSFALNQQVILNTEECCNCGILFALPASMQARLKTNGGTFYCPNGHSQHYTETEEMRLRKKLDEQTRQATAMAERAKNAEIAEQAAVKAQKKLEAEARRLKKRAQAGVCSCCNRTFQNLARHMNTKHKTSEVKP